MKNKRWENADYLKTKSANYEALKLATNIRDQAFEIKFHHGKTSLRGEFKKLRSLVDKMENLLTWGKKMDKQRYIEMMVDKGLLPNEKSELELKLDNCNHTMELIRTVVPILVLIIQIIILFKI